MSTSRFAIALAGCASLLLAGCAVSPAAESERAAIEADINEILSLPLDPAEYGEAKRCLSDAEFQSFRALDDRHILFEGRHGRQWINSLAHTCTDLSYGDVLVVKSFDGLRMCKLDTFHVADWFTWPWYRRWPWYWGRSWGTGALCTLGEFQPVSKAQVDEIEALLDSR